VKEAKTVVGAREQADEVHNAIVAYLKESGVKEGDIKTVNYSLNPKYEWQAAGQVICRDGFCPPAGKQVVVGYEVHESISAKVRDIDGAGAILVGVTERGATNVNGPNLTVDNPDAAEREARAAAIKEAQAKAALLAKDLGVRLVRIVSFNESGATGPIFYGKEMAMGMGGDARAAPPSIEPGENRIVSNVSIVYEIR